MFMVPTKVQLVWWQYNWDFKSRTVLLSVPSNQDQFGVCGGEGWVIDHHDLTEPWF